MVLEIMNNVPVVLPYKNKHDHPIMSTGKNRNIRHTPIDFVNYCNTINACCETTETAHKDWVKNQGTNQGPFKGSMSSLL